MFCIKTHSQFISFIGIHNIRMLWIWKASHSIKQFCIVCIFIKVSQIFSQKLNKILNSYLNSLFGLAFIYRQSSSEKHSDRRHAFAANDTVFVVLLGAWLCVGNGFLFNAATVLDLFQSSPNLFVATSFFASVYEKIHFRVLVTHTNSIISLNHNETK